MGAVGSDREKFAANPHQQDRLFTDAAEQLGSVSKCVLRKAEAKIRATGIGMSLHLTLSTVRGRDGYIVSSARYVVDDNVCT